MKFELTILKKFNWRGHFFGEMGRTAIYMQSIKPRLMASCLLLLFWIGVVAAQSSPTVSDPKNSATINSSVLSLYPSHSSSAMKTAPRKVVSNSFYTIQVYASCARNFAEAFVRCLPNTPKFSIIKVKQGICSTYKVIYGKYSSYKKACQALQNTHDKLAKYKPWVTKISSDTYVVPVVTVSKHNKAKKHLRKATVKKKVGFYVEGGLVYYRNLASRESNQVNIQPVPGVPYYPVSYDNASHANGVGLYLGGGYRWWLSPRWSWSLGGRLSYHSLEQKGNWHYNWGPKTDYNYDINTLVINALVHLNWHASLRNTVYGEVTGGIANVKSQNFRLTGTNLSAAHINNTTHNFDYGFAVGWLYAVTKQISVNVAIGYQDLGKASLGTRVVRTGATSKGNVEQRLRGLSARIGLVHWF